MAESVDPTLPLIRTKLAPPRIGSASVERRALLETLAKHHLRRLHLLVGPAGSGKTSVLVQWRKQRLEAGDRVAWYSAGADDDELRVAARSEEHTSELQSLMRISYAVFCLKKKKIHK